MAAIEAFAPAKVNLTLHVTGRRADGYHLLDSLVCFADVGDRLRVRRADRTRLTVSGPFAAGLPTGPDNLVLRAAALLGLTAGIALEKSLPVASGLGGGSADAAAAIAALCTLHGRPGPDPAALIALGADVPVCATGGLVRMRGIGEALDPLGGVMSRPMVLANPGIPVPTPEVFARLAHRDNPPMPDSIPDPAGADFPDWLLAQRNDLEAPAIALVPEIGRLLPALRAQPGCRIARMTGSGASCYALFDADAEAAEAARALGRAHPGWWVTACRAGQGR